MPINKEYVPIDNQPTIKPRTVTGIFTRYIAKTLPLAFDESMSYYECLCALLDYINTKVIPALDNNAAGLLELQEFYEDLQTYVNDYFKNLDVQEEINNKLDDMAESGQLTDIIAQYLGLAGMIAFDNVADMKEAQNLVNGSKCRTLGYYNVNDGGGAYYKIRQVTNDDVIDEMTIIEVYDNLLVAELIIENNEVNINQLGAKNDGITDNKTNIEKAISLSYNKKIKINMMSGTYAFSGIITVPENQNGITLTGSNEFTTVLKALSNNTQINFTNFLRSRIENIRFEGTGEEEVPIIYLNGVSHLSEISNCTFYTNLGIFINSSAYLKISDCSFTRHATAPSESSYLLKCTSGANEYLYVQNCYFEGSSTTVNCSPVQIAGGHNIYFDNCDFCNWYGGVGLKIGGSNAIKEISVTNSTFVRNNHAIILQCDYGISNVRLDNNTFILLTGNETSIITNQRTSGTGVTSMVHGYNIIDANYDISSKTMLYTLSGIFTNGNLLFDSISNSFPDYTNGFPAYFNLNIPNNRVLSGTGETVNVTLSTKSPYKSYNIPDIKFFKYNGANPISMDVSNTYQGNLILTFNYASGTTNPYSEVQLRIKN